MASLQINLLTSFVLLSTAFGLEPEFKRPLNNITVPEGRDATFTCVVHHLGGHKVAWIKSDSKAILAIHNAVITHFNRLSVAQSDHNTWTLTLRNVRQSDSGPYMCQVNTDPMRYQVGLLEVVVPPDIVTSETSSDIIIPEGAGARLHCKADGYPPPTISWRREDGQDIVLKDGPRKEKVTHVTSEVLELKRVTRSEMGVYLCIANNGIPPPVSKRTMVTVNFPPQVEVTNALLSAHIGGTVMMACRVEASPQAIYYWSRGNDAIILSDSRRRYGNSSSLYRYNMTLTISPVREEDFASYRCVAKNSIGEAEGVITLHRVMLPSSTGPDEYFTEPSRPLGDTREYEPSGDLPPFTDDEDFPYGRQDEPARPRGQAADWPDLRSEEAKSSAWGRHGAVVLVVLTVVSCTDVFW
ncbi:opioid-binding protein/cell adhesion molecule homolog [Amphibalanus amphitrite]|uniref:opioid-binding protein/cell adhesion molecule homolog n=1 Tax=Amphibalanus amphitrite TaxID=1232801 RepID=UPI001C923F2E|nr:opioid-binding protein/cell adhesion molecule homolog [Amphibalanus amphitrite]